MKPGSLNKPLFALLAALCLGLRTADAQVKPPDSTSKVRKVLLYNKVGGWASVDGISQVKAVFLNLAATKGFELVQSADDGPITLEYLKQFQVLVWNNNSNGGASMPSAAARQAVLDYVSQGGGWLLLHRAGDHGNTWPALAEALGTQFTQHGMTGAAAVVVDAGARAHKELKWMLPGFPDTIELEDRWLSFTGTVRPLPGVTVIATARGGTADVLRPMADGSSDHVYLWARSIGKGRLIYNAIGSGLNGIMEQQDSLVPRLYWENLRYAAGDFQNGCMQTWNENFDPAARIHDYAHCIYPDPFNPLGVQPSGVPGGITMSRGGFGMHIASPEGQLRIRLRDLQGALVWERRLPAGTRALSLDGAIGPGVYQVEVRGVSHTIRRRLALP